jgi:hypothetical protein
MYNTTCDGFYLQVPVTSQFKIQTKQITTGYDVVPPSHKGIPTLT